MASYLKPRRGTYSTAKNQLSTAATCLKNGEIFFELNSSGAGKGMGKIKMGDGSTSYSSLPYFLSLTDNGITFTATESTNQLSSFSSGVTIPNAFRYIRSTLSYLVTQVTNLNNDFFPNMSVSQACNKLYNEIAKKLSGGYTALTQIGIGTGYFYLSNGVCVEYGTFPSQSMVADAKINGYSATITLNSGIKTFYFAMASSIYPGGFPNTVICERLSGKIKIGSNAAVSGLYVSWLVIGTK